jgi:hypothetical protein
MASKFGDTSAASTWLTLQREVGLRFRMTSEPSLRLPGIDVPTLRFAQEMGPKRPGKDLS